MSYPWWRFKVKYQDGFETTWHYTEISPLHALSELVGQFVEAASYGPTEDIPLEMVAEYREHGEVIGLECLGMGTFDEEEVGSSERVVTVE